MAERAEVVFVDGVRTPFGRAGEKGMYWNTRADDLIVKAMIGLTDRNPNLPKDRVDDVGIAATTQQGDQGLTLGRTAALLAGLKEFTGRASRTQIDRWWAAIEAGRVSEDLPSLRVQSDTIPPARVWSDKNPEADKRLKAARAAITALSEQMSIPVENLLTPESLRRVAWKPPVDPSVEAIAQALEDVGARPWQIDATAQVIHSAFVEALQSPEPAPDTES